MGTMKRIYTERQMHGKSLARFARSEREAIRAITRNSEALLSYLAEEAAPKPTAGGVALSSIWLGSVYTGNMPERAGIYVVVDTVTETRDIVKLVHYNNQWMIFRVGQSQEIQLSAYNKSTFHWFLLHELGPDDMKFVRKELP